MFVFMGQFRGATGCRTTATGRRTGRVSLTRGLVLCSLRARAARALWAVCDVTGADHYTLLRMNYDFTVHGCLHICIFKGALAARSEIKRMTPSPPPKK